MNKEKNCVMVQEDLEIMKKNAMMAIVGKKLKVGIKTTTRGDLTIGFDFVNATVFRVEDSGVVFYEENGTRFFVLYEDMKVDIGMKEQPLDFGDAMVIVQNAVID
jgi:hypothetical protein